MLPHLLVKLLDGDDGMADGVRTPAPQLETVSHQEVK